MRPLLHNSINIPPWTDRIERLIMTHYLVISRQFSQCNTCPQQHPRSLNHPLCQLIVDIIPEEAYHDIVKPKRIPHIPSPSNINISIATNKEIVVHVRQPHVGVVVLDVEHGPGTFLGGGAKLRRAVRYDHQICGVGEQVVHLTVRGITLSIPLGLCD